jgi:hypothetical protein
MKSQFLSILPLLILLVSCSKQTDPENTARDDLEEPSSFTALLSSQSGGSNDLAEFLNKGKNVSAINASDGANFPVITENEQPSNSTSFASPASNKNIDLNEYTNSVELGVAGDLTLNNEIANLQKIIAFKDKTIASLNLLNDELLIQIKKLRGGGLSENFKEYSDKGVPMNRVEELQEEIAQLRSSLLGKSEELSDLSGLNSDLASRLSILNQDQSWNLNRSRKLKTHSDAPELPSNSVASLEFDAVVTLQNGKNKEIFYTEFFLLRNGLDQLLMGEGILLSDYSQIDSYDELWAKSRKSPFVYPGLHKRIRNILLKEIELGRGYRVRTDIDGFALVKTLEIGNYFLLGMSPMGQVGTIWNLPLRLNAGLNKISLNLSNAAWSN